MPESIVIKDNHISFTLRFPKPKDPFVSSLQKACKRALENELGNNITTEISTIFPEPIKREKPEVLPGVKHIIAVSSGKGGVGKSTITANLAIALAQKGYKVGLLDADIYGPSVPKMFGVETARPAANKRDGKDWIQPVEKYGVKMLSVGFFVDPKDATVWRGPMATSALKQLINQGDWGELDYLLLDLPPGTGDIHLTLVQEVPVTGTIIVSTPQDIALADVIKGISMFQNKTINVPVLGLVENMAWFTPKELPNNKYYIFGEEGCKKLAEERGLDLLGQIPLVQGIREGGDKGAPAALDDEIYGAAFGELAINMLSALEKRQVELPASQKVNVVKK